MSQEKWSNFIERYKVSLRMLIPYLVFLALFMTIGYIVYEKTLQMMQSEAIKSNKILLEQSKATMDQRLADIDRIVKQMYLDPKLSKLLNVSAPFNGTNTYKVIETLKNLMNVSLYNQFIFDYDIFYNKGNLVLSNDTVYEMPKFYEHVLRYDNQSYEEWRAQWLDHYYAGHVLPANHAVYMDQTKSFVTYLQSIGVPGLKQGVIAVLIDNDEILKLLKGVDVSGGGSAYIMDAEGQVITFVSSTAVKGIPMLKEDLPGVSGVIEPSGKSSMFVTYTTSDYNGWTYIAAQSKQVVLRKANYIKNIFFTVFFIALGAGIVLAYVMAYRNRKPLQTILQQISQQFDGGARPSGDLYRFIRDSFSSIHDSQRRLESRIKEQLPLLRTAFLERLLKGEVRIKETAEALSQHIGIDMRGCRYAVVLVQLLGYEKVLNKEILSELDVDRVKIKIMLQELFGDEGHLHDIAEDKIAILFIIRRDEPEHGYTGFSDILKQAHERAAGELTIRATFAAGGLYQSLADLPRSYEEARQALHYKRWTNHAGVIVYGELPQESNLHYFPPEAQTRLIHCGAAGDETEVRRILEELHSEYFVQKHLSLPVLNMLIHEVWSSVLRTYAHIGISTQSLFDEVAACSGRQLTAEELETSFGNAIDAFVRICRHVNEHKKSGNKELLGSIIQTMQANYANPNLCLESVADELDISRVYLSQFFKEQTGINFSDHLEAIRMEYARGLLRNTALSVHEIAESAGYSSLNTFGRAFKRIHGLSATAYRQTAVAHEKTDSFVL